MEHMRGINTRAVRIRQEVSTYRGTASGNRDIRFCIASFNERVSGIVPVPCQRAYRPPCMAVSAIRLDLLRASASR